MSSGPFRSFGIADTVTYGSLGCAALSIHFSITGNVYWGALFWCASAILDNLDGKFASLFPRSQQQRDIGAQLDALVDVAAFGVAPVVGVLAWTSGHSPSIVPWALGICILYMACAVLRLAHFQLREAAGQHEFVGLPTTEASVLVAAAFLLPDLSGGVLLGVMGLVAVTMVSPFAFRRPHWGVIVLLIGAILTVMTGLFGLGR